MIRTRSRERPCESRDSRSPQSSSSWRRSGPPLYPADAQAPRSRTPPSRSTSRSNRCCRIGFSRGSPQARPGRAGDPPSWNEKERRGDLEVRCGGRFRLFQSRDTRSYGPLARSSERRYPRASSITRAPVRSTDRSRAENPLAPRFSSMATLLRRASERLRAGAFLTLLVACWLAPPAWAGCGHHALRVELGLTGAVHFPWLAATGALVMPTNQGDSLEGILDPDVPALPDHSCDGPSCSSRDEQPAAPATVTIVPTADLWAWFRLTKAGNGSNTRLRTHQLARLRPIRFAPTIFHPPRPESV